MKTAQIDYLRFEIKLDVLIQISKGSKKIFLKMKV